jgi:hypothetical protein
MGNCQKAVNQYWLGEGFLEEQRFWMCCTFVSEILLVTNTTKTYAISIPEDIPPPTPSIAGQ